MVKVSARSNSPELLAAAAPPGFEPDGMLPYAGHPPGLLNHALAVRGRSQRPPKRCGEVIASVKAARLTCRMCSVTSTPRTFGPPGSLLKSNSTRVMQSKVCIAYPRRASQLQRCWRSGARGERAASGGIVVAVSVVSPSVWIVFGEATGVGMT